MKRWLYVITLFTVLMVFAAGHVSAAPFYQGKVLRITVGFSAGGGFDLWARLVARHLGKQIPGNPTVIVENITGAGGLIQTNQLYKATKPDGLIVGYLNGGLILGQMMSQPGYDFDPQKFIYVGAAGKDNEVFVLSKKSGITSAEKWRTSPTPVKLGGMAPGNTVDNVNRAMKDVLGFPTQLVSGYKGTADIRLATESGEIAGANVPWDTSQTSWKRSIESGDLVIVIQCVKNPLKEIPKVPRMIDFAKTQEQKTMIEVIVHSANEFSRPFVLTPGTPQDRVEILRKAFADTMKDKEFLAEAAKMQVTVDPSSGEELTAAVSGAAKLDQSTLAKLKDILFR